MINNRPLTMVGSDPEDLELQLLHYRLCLGDPIGNLWYKDSQGEDIAKSPISLWSR